MSNSYDIQRRLDSQLARTHHAVSSLTSSTLSQEEGPGIGDMMAFKQAMLQEMTSNYTAGQYGSLKHSMSKAIIDAIN